MNGSRFQKIRNHKPQIGRAVAAATFERTDLVPAAPCDRSAKSCTSNNGDFITRLADRVERQTNVKSRISKLAGLGRSPLGLLPGDFRHPHFIEIAADGVVSASTVRIRPGARR